MLEGNFQGGFLAVGKEVRSMNQSSFCLFLKGANLNLHSVALLENDRRTGEISWKPPEKLSHEKTRL